MSSSLTTGESGAPGKPSTTSLYVHRPLSSSSECIRILELLPAAVVKSPIRCNIKEIRLADARRSQNAYEALSYVWGSPDTKHPIYCGSDGAILKVTTNCWTALRALRRRRRSRILWIDAICIDQRAEERPVQERNEQIKLMGEVYHRAMGVVVWLGTGRLSARHVFAASVISVMDPLLSSVEVGVITQLNKTLINAVIRSMTFGDPPDNDNGNIASASELNNIILNPWFRRVWTIQELLFARKCVLRQGSFAIEWTNFCRFYEAIDHCVANPAIHARDDATHFIKHWKKKDFDVNSEYHVAELEFLASLMRHQSTIPLDKIFSIFPLGRRLGIEMPEPDYNKTTPRAYEEFTRAWIRSRRKLSILALAERPGSMPHDIPSWVPDWGKSDLPEDSYPDMSGWEGLARQISSWTKGFCASKQSDTPLVGMEITGQLPVLGKRVGIITSRYVSEVLGSLEHLSHQIQDAFTLFLKDMCRAVQAASPLPDGDTALTGLYHSSTYHMRKQSSLSRDTFDNLVDLMLYPNCKSLSLSYVERHADKQSRFAVESYLAYAATSQSDQLAKDIHAAYTAVFKLANHALFFLDTGHMGRALHNVREGDEVFLLAGCPWPMVLRSGGETYNFIAPAYLHGAMLGELWTNNPGDLENITIT